MADVGICSIGSYLPFRRLLTSDTINNWNNSSNNLIENNFGVKARTVLNSDEDVITLANESSIRCISNSNINSNKLDSIFFGTITSPELFRGCSNLLMESLTDKCNYLSSDVASAESSGLVSLIMSYSSVKSGVSDYSLSVGSDTLCRNTAPGDLRESYEGAGSSSILVGKKNIIAEIISSKSCNSNFPEIGRTEDERFIRELMPMNSEINKLGLFKHTLYAIKSYCSNNRIDINEFNYVILPQQYPGQTKSIAKYLKLNKDKVVDSIFSDYTGDVGSAAPFIALQNVLNKANPNEYILVCSYGHNSGANVVGLKTTEYLLEYRNNIKHSIEELLSKNYKYVSYSDAMRIEYKLVGPNISIGTFN